MTAIADPYSSNLPSRSCFGCDTQHKLHRYCIQGFLNDGYMYLCDSCAVVTDYHQRAIIPPPRTILVSELKSRNLDDSKRMKFDLPEDEAKFIQYCTEFEDNDDLKTWSFAITKQIDRGDCNVAEWLRPKPYKEQIRLEYKMASNVYFTSMKWEDLLSDWRLCRNQEFIHRYDEGVTIIVWDIVEFIDVFDKQIEEKVKGLKEKIKRCTQVQERMRRIKHEYQDLQQRMKEEEELY